LITDFIIADTNKDGIDDVILSLYKESEEVTYIKELIFVD
jgi:hypothetical protein